MKRRFPAFSLFMMALAVCSMGFFSGQSGASSGHLSELVARFFYTHLPLEPLVAFPAFHHFIRKLAHFTLFAVFGFGAEGLGFYLFRRHGWVFAILFGAFFAGCDELRQFLFAIERHGCLTDVLIDTSGAAFGALVHALLRRIFYKIRPTQE